MADFLLELLSEEIPARMQAKASVDLARLFGEQLAAAGLAAEAIETWATPRRLALVARGLPTETASVSEELKGPRSNAPPQALEGFLRKTGLTRDQLVERDGVYFGILDKPGRATAAVLAEAVPAIVRAFPWPKSMRWGAASVSTESPRWVRPLHGILALLGEEIVDFEIAGVKSGAATVGHRFHHPGPITIGGAHDYAEKLRACHVVLDPAERRRIVAEGAARLAAEAGLALIEDEGLLAENAGLTEWPMPLLGAFDPAFLDVPAEVIRLTMRTNQKYFALTDGEGALAPNFVCVANIEASDGGGAIVEGNRKVLAARLADAKFFWEQDLKVPLAEQAKKLGQIVFHEKLGTVADKVERVAKLARWLVEEGIVGGEKIGEEQSVRVERSRDTLPSEAEGRSEAVNDGSQGLGSARRGPSTSLGTNGGGMSAVDLADLAETAARLCKADLVTGLVGEFPELQGAIGGHLARAQGQDPQVADAIRDHYKPVGQGDEVPTAPVTVAVSLADKLDSLVGFFGRDMAPTGSKDPFALRRSAMGLLSLIIGNSLRVPIDNLIAASAGEYLRQLLGPENQPLDEDLHWKLGEFIEERLKIQQRESGVRHDLITAVAALRIEGDFVRLLARVKALQAFVETAEGADLLAGYKRAANILKKEDWGQPSGVIPAEAGTHEHRDSNAGAEISASGFMGPGFRRDDSSEAEQPGNKTLSYTPEKEENALIAALDSAGPKAAAAVEAEDFEGAMAALASLRAPVDAFFDKVTVNDPDPAKREARLDLLARMRDAVHRVADFSRIEG